MTEFFFELTPDRVLDAVETAGYRCTGRCLALNSYENRVYDVELEEPLEGVNPDVGFDPKKCVIKFYRPGRWSQAQIQDEHDFLLELGEAGVPVVEPLAFVDGKTLHQTKIGSLWYTLFPRARGRAPYELSDEHLYQLGQVIGLMHEVGSEHPAPSRLTLNVENFGLRNLEFLLKESWIPPEFTARYEAAVRKICSIAQEPLDQVTPIRIHGDCHHGNILWGSHGPFFLDFDDMVMGPPVQDFWLLVSGREEVDKKNMQVFLEGYEEVLPFDRTTLPLVEALRALRYVNYSAWIAKRWKDPAFPAAFPDFNSTRYWDEKTKDLEDQLQTIQESMG